MTPLKQAIIPPRQTPLADRTSALRSATTRLGQALSTSLESSTYARSSGRRRDVAPTIPVARPAASNADTHTPPHCTRRATLVTRSLSSQRRRSSSPSSQTPRRGEKQKRQRRGHNAPHDVINGATLPDAIDLSVPIDDHFIRRALSSNHRPTTDFLGWRRLHFDEIVSVRVRQSIIVVIPTDVRSDHDLTKKKRKLSFNLKSSNEVVLSLTVLFVNRIMTCFASILSFPTISSCCRKSSIIPDTNN